MECNKDEAIRAMGIAEKRMQNSDFEGALKVAKKAKELFPELENISQLLAICEVHCSALHKLHGSAMDWYRILQTEKLADEATVKRQYRKLALLLHPDKNKYAGAEAAFKLVGEAHMVLSDQAKRSLYDMKYTCSAASMPTTCQPNREPFVKEQSRMENNPPDPYTNLKRYQRVAPLQTFWTCCINCNMKYQCHKDFENKQLCCQSCSKVFIAHDLSTQGVPIGNRWHQFPNQETVSNHGPSNVTTQVDGGKPNSRRFPHGNQPPNHKGSSKQGPPKVTSQIGSRKSSTMRSPDGFVGLGQDSKAGNSAEVRGGSKTEVEPDNHVDMEGVEVHKSNAGKSRKLGSSKSGSRKRKKSAAESSKSCEPGGTDINAKNVGMHKFDIDLPGKNSGNERRPSRQNRSVHSQKNLKDDNDDFVNPRAGAPEERFPNKKIRIGEYYTEKEAANSDIVDRNPMFDDVPKLTSVISIEVPDTQFNDFEACKKENCFAVNQIWAIYDPVDGMPRFYAHIKKVLSPGFKLHITWLEADPDGQDEVDWCSADLPISCGKYKLDATEETVDCLMFSHQMQCIKGSGRVSYLVYPRKGETWALFKDWDIRWSSDPKMHLSFKYEFVEVLSDFVNDVGIRVAYLGKVKGFVSLFQQTALNGAVSFQVPANELYRFSHQIPSFRMTGEEKEGVPKGSFELDPAALPTDLDEYDDPGVVKMENRDRDTEFCGSHCKSSDNKVERVVGSDMDLTAKKDEMIEQKTSVLKGSSSQSNSGGINHGKVDANQCKVKEGASKENSYHDLTQPKGITTSCLAGTDISTPRKFKTPNKHEKQDMERKSLNLRRSPRNLSRTDDQTNGSQSMKHGTVKHLDDNKEENRCIFTMSRGNVSCQFGAKRRLGLKEHSSSSSTERPGISSPMNSSCKILEAELNSFNGCNPENFQLDQIWAIYNERSGMPRNYAQVKKIESTPEFRLHVAMLEPCLLPKGTSHPVCCGMFKVKNFKTKVLSCSAFSHRLRAESVGENIYKIYPRKGEVWALYKNLSSRVTCSDMRKGEYDIVEVLEDNDQSTETVVLSPLNGSKSVFKSPRIQRSKSGVLVIPHVEITRFSHQIPAFQHSGETDSCLRGCWVLDPTAVPGVIICLD